MSAEDLLSGRDVLIRSERAQWLLNSLLPAMSQLVVAGSHLSLNPLVELAEALNASQAMPPMEGEIGVPAGVSGAEMPSRGAARVDGVGQEWVTPDEASKRYGGAISGRRVRQLANAGVIPHRPPAPTYLVDVDAVGRYLEREPDPATTP